MIVVLKNKDLLEKKITSLIEETVISKNRMLTIVTNESMFDEVNRTVRGMNIGIVKYGKEELFITKLGVKLEILKADKYI